jgi:TolA-binding protein
MYKRTFLALGLASLPGVVQPATAGQSELEQIRAEMREMRQAYKNRIEALENRIEELENRQETPAAETAAPAETPAPAQTAEPAQPSAPTAANAFNPAISLILEGIYTHAPDGTRLLPGFFFRPRRSAPKSGVSAWPKASWL